MSGVKTQAAPIHPEVAKAYEMLARAISDLGRRVAVLERGGGPSPVAPESPTLEAAIGSLADRLGHELEDLERAVDRLCRGRGRPAPSVAKKQSAPPFDPAFR